MDEETSFDTAGGWTRRGFLTAAAAATLTGAARARARAASPHAGVPIIDGHIHLFDASRPQGAPYKGPKDFSSHVSLPGEYHSLAAPLGIVGAVVVEASHWLEDNLWVLEVAQPDSIIVGVIGYLPPDKADFPDYLERFHKNPLYRGIRFDNNARNHLADQLDVGPFVDNLKLLAQADLSLDTANPSLDLLATVVRVNDKVPDLRIILDHLPALDPTPEGTPAYQQVLKEIQQRPNIFVKLSEILHPVDGQVALDLQSHRARLDYLVSVFGEDRILFGSDYPNSVGTATLDQIVSLTREYFASRPRSVAEKYFWKNSLRCYKWVKRAADQPVLT
jgi:L-fuconolactonase